MLLYDLVEIQYDLERHGKALSNGLKNIENMQKLLRVGRRRLYALQSGRCDRKFPDSSEGKNLIPISSDPQARDILSSVDRWMAQVLGR